MIGSYSIEVNTRLDVRDELLVCRMETGSHSAEWQLRIKDLVLIAEYTTSEGPYCDDYFLVFWVKEDGKLLKVECSFYAEGMEDALVAIRQWFGTAIELGLCASTEWKSRIVWPEQLQGRPYFEFSKVEPAGLLPKLRSLVIGGQLEYRPTIEVQDYLSRLT